MEAHKLNPEQVKAFYVDVHRTSLSNNPAEETAPVIFPDGCKLLNDFTSFAHRLGMRRGFEYLTRQRGSLAGLEVLDIGCGRGRWCKEYAARGARVTGVDISPDAIEWLSARFPDHRFLCADVAGMPFPEASFDIVNSVTVLQHMPGELQSAVFRDTYKFLKKGGYFIILENIADFGYPMVFPHPVKEWASIGESAGFRLRRSWGSNFEVPIRAMVRIRGGVHSVKTTPGRAVPPVRKMETLAKNCISIASFPIELLCHYAPLARPSHALMIFEKAK